MPKQILKIDDFGEYLEKIEKDFDFSESKNVTLRARAWVQRILFTGLIWEQCFALLPITTSSGKRIWLDKYYKTNIIHMYKKCVVMDKNEFMLHKLQNRLSL